MLAVSQGRLVALSTPWGRRGWFYHEWSQSEQWQKIRITARDCPRLTEEILEQERESLGEAWFRQEYLCEFVDAGAEGFIYADWLEDCAGLDLKPVGPVDIGLDVARSPRGDDTVFCLTQGTVVTSLERYSGQDLMSTCGRAVRLIEQTEARSIRIDDTGVGGGVTDRLKVVQREAERGSVLQQCEGVPMGFGKKAGEPQRFVDLRTEIPVDDGMRSAIKELSVLPDGSMIPFVTRGPIDDPKTELDPAFLGEVVKAYLKKLAEDELGKGIGEIIDLFKKKGGR